MKKVMFLMLVGSLVLAGCKKEGCTNSNATNYDEKAKTDDGSCILPVIEEPIDPTDPTSDTEKPVVTITAPAANAKVKSGDKLTITATVTDNASAASWMYAILDAADKEVSNSGTLTLGKTTSEEGNSEYAIPASAEAGNYTISVTATDAVGNVSTAVTVVIVVESSDAQAPEITEPNVTFPVGGTMSSGTGAASGAKVTLAVSDDVELSWVKAYLYDTDNSVAIDSLIETDINAKTWGKTKHQFTYARTDAQSQKGAIKVVAQDKAGNETTVTGSKVLTFGL